MQSLLRVQGTINFLTELPLYVGTDNVRSSAVVDHAKSAMHTRAMDVYRIKTQAPSPVEYAPIARALARDILDPAAKERLVKKFEIAFFIAKEKLPFTKFSPLYNWRQGTV